MYQHLLRLKAKRVKQIFVLCFLFSLLGCGEALDKTIDQNGGSNQPGQGNKRKKLALDANLRFVVIDVFARQKTTPDAGEVALLGLRMQKDQLVDNFILAREATEGGGSFCMRVVGQNYDKVFEEIQGLEIDLSLTDFLARSANDCSP
jgi:hypothetical protein